MTKPELTKIIAQMKVELEDHTTGKCGCKKDGTIAIREAWKTTEKNLRGSIAYLEKELEKMP